MIPFSLSTANARTTSGSALTLINVRFSSSTLSCAVITGSWAMFSRWPVGSRVGVGSHDGLVDELGKEFLIGFGETTTPRAYRVRQTGSTVQPNDHCALRWMTADQLAAVASGLADRAWLPHLSRERSDRR